MNKNLRHQLTVALSPNQKTLIVRFGVSYALFLAIFFFLQSPLLGHILGYLFVGPIGFDAFALLLPPFGIAFFLFLERTTLRGLTSIPYPTTSGVIVRGTALVSMVTLAGWITHPNLDRLRLIESFINTYDPMAEPFVATGLYAVLFLPLLPSLFLLLPRTFLSRYITAFVAGTSLLIFYIFVHPLEAFYHVATGSTLIKWVGGLLRLLPGDTVLSPERWEVQYRGFSVVLGPLRSGFTAMSLFVAIFCALWWLLSKRGGVYHGRAVLALSTGVVMFFFINILRIVLIMIIGSFSRVIGMVLFHGTAGSLFFFLVIVVVIRFVMPLLRRESHDTVRR